MDLLEAKDPCGYFKEKISTYQYFSSFQYDADSYHGLMNMRFRRSGTVFYKPVCENCNECKPIRIGASDFELSKSLRRILKKNEDITMEIGEPTPTEEKFELYNKYQQLKHGASEKKTARDIISFLYFSPVNTMEIEYKLEGKVICISIVDLSASSLSAVYTYYDPDYSDRSLGTYSAIKEILLCRERNVPYYYFGYYIKDCPAMSYKARFKPYEILSAAGVWEKIIEL